MRDLIIAGISTGMRLGELLSLQWREVEHATNAKGEPVAAALHLAADKTKDSDPRRVPVGTRLAAVLAMRRHGPDGKALKPDAYVFGNEVGERVRSVKRAWGTTKLRAHGVKPVWIKGSNRLAPESLAALKVIDLHFHDLRAEFRLRVIESGGSTVEMPAICSGTPTPSRPIPISAPGPKGSRRPSRGRKRTKPSLPPSGRGWRRKRKIPTKPTRVTIRALQIPTTQNRAKS